MKSSLSFALLLLACAAFAQEKRTVLIPMRDGLRLATDLYGVDDGQRLPVLLMRTPYDKNGGAATAKRYAAAGYAVAVQDARGAFASEGRYFHHNNDDQDGFDTIEWLARQPWSNGKVGTWGSSHPGSVQWLAAGDRPPGLAVMAPTAASPSLYDTAYVGGALRLALIGGAGPAITKPPTGQSTPADLVPFYRTRPLTELGPAIGWEMPWLRGILAHPYIDGFWARQHATERVKGLNLPVQHMVGYFDFLCRETVASFQRMRKSPARDAQQLIIGPWDHGTGRGRKLGDFDFGETALVSVVEENLQWFNRFLKPGSSDAPFPRVRYFVIGRNEWRTAPDWPPPAAVDAAFYLHSAGRANTRKGNGRLLATPAAKAQPPDQFVSDPDHPVPVDPPGVSPIPRSTMFRPLDVGVLEDREDVLVYTAAPQRQELIVAGSPKAELWVSVDAEDADYTVKLLDVWPTGAAYPMAEGVLRLTHRLGDAKPAPVTAGKVYRVTVDLGHTAFALAPGHALRIEIAGSYFPAYDLNSHTGEGPFAKSAKAARQTVHHTPLQPSRLILPVR